jgi:broad specificity phosphatase PhoE
MTNSLIPSLPFYFVRHGETNWNLKNKRMGSQDIELNQTGSDQSYSAAYILAEMEISKIFTSPQKRAKETANIIASVCELDIEILENLKERNLGEFEGTNNEVSFLNNKGLPKDAEDYNNFKDRIIQSFNELLTPTEMYPLIVSHGGVFEVLSHILADKSNINCPNGQIFFFTPPINNNIKWDITKI